MIPSQCPTRAASALSCKTTTTRQPLLLLAYRSRVTGHNQAWPNPGALRRRNWPLGDHCRRRGVMGFASMLAYSLFRYSHWHIRYCRAAYALTFHIALSLVVFSASRVHPATPLVYRKHLSHYTSICTPISYRHRRLNSQTRSPRRIHSIVYTSHLNSGASSALSRSMLALFSTLLPTSTTSPKILLASHDPLPSRVVP